VLEAHNIDPELDDEIYDGPAEVWGAKGVDMLSARAKSVTPRQNSPPHPNDALYPLHMFIQQEFPRGGNFDLTSVDKYQDSKEHTRAFVRFLKTSEYRDHPYASIWLAKLDRSNPSTGILSSNLPILRNVKLVQRKTHQRDEYLFIGPPGSATTDPFNVQNEQCCVSRALIKEWKKNGRKDPAEEVPTKKRSSKYPTSHSQQRSKQRK
jgi:hypothetical protein